MVPYNFLKCLFCICEICRWYFDRDCIETWFLILKTYCMLWPEITQWTTLVTLPSCGWHSSGEGRSKSSTSTEMLHKHYGDHSLHKARGEEGPEGLGCLFARGHKWGSEPYNYLRKKHLACSRKNKKINVIYVQWAKGRAGHDGIRESNGTRITLAFSHSKDFGLYLNLRAHHSTQFLTLLTEARRGLGCLW